jgi:phosphonate transport system ATP-binding protein
MTQPATPCIAISGVSVNYGATLALDDISLTINTGERVAVVGPSGAGKSTLIALANSSLTPSRGHVEILGACVQNLTQRQRRTLRAHIATMYQGLHMPGSLRVIHNVNAGRLGSWSTSRALWSLVRPQATEDARSALARFGLGDALWRRTDELSGGERQRVALARLVVQDPGLILADEPTASLDPARSVDVLRQLTELCTAGKTLVVSLHAFDLARAHFDRVIGLRDGRLVFDLASHLVTDAHGTQLYELDPVS